MDWRGLIIAPVRSWPGGLFLGVGGIEVIDALVGLHAKPDELTFGQRIGAGFFSLWGRHNVGASW
jgi:hypothetical protein